MIAWLLLLLSLLFDVSYPSSTSFDLAELVVYGAVKTPLDFTINFRTTREISSAEQIGVVLPRFTQRLSDYQDQPSNISFSDLLVSPSATFKAQWLEGINVYGEGQLPYPSPVLIIAPKINASIAANSYVSLKVFKENGIGVVCGFAGLDVLKANTSLVYPSKPFTIGTVLPGLVPYEVTVLLINTTYDNSGALVSNTSVITELLRTRNGSIFANDSHPFDLYTGVGSGCAALGKCSGHGRCDYCYEQCRCFEGWGADSDLLLTGASPSYDCSERVCPSGRAFGDLPVAEDQAHGLAECSNQGVCHRVSGQCNCTVPFSGSACEKMSCPRNCSGHGRCLSMADMARVESLASPQRPATIYGSGAGMNTVAWDYQSIFGCVCDSAWPVGFDFGETQLAQYFGPDCSLKHCPSGDDPFTMLNETDCTGKSQVAGRMFPLSFPPHS